MPLIATLWWPRLDPIGPASLFALIAGTLYWVLVELSVLKRFQTQIVIAASTVFISFLLLSAAPVIGLFPFEVFGWKYKRFPNLDDYLGNYVLMTVGLVLALKIRGRSRRVAIVLAAFFGALIIAEFAAMLYWRYAR